VDIESLKEKEGVRCPVGVRDPTKIPLQKLLLRI
jgi:hypothetical protein